MLDAGALGLPLRPREAPSATPNAGEAAWESDILEERVLKPAHRALVCDVAKAVRREPTLPASDRSSLRGPFRGTPGMKLGGPHCGVARQGKRMQVRVCFVVVPTDTSELIAPDSA